MKDMAGAFALKSGESFTKQQAIDWFARHYPKIKTATITAHLVKLATNAPSRVHYNVHPGEDDLFFRLDANHFRLYDSTNDPAQIHSTADVPGKEARTDEEDWQELS